MLVWSAPNWSISSEICHENNHKIAPFLPIAFWWGLPRKLPRNSREIGRFFREFVSKNPAKFDFFFRDLSEALDYLLKVSLQILLPPLPEIILWNGFLKKKQKQKQKQN